MLNDDLPCWERVRRTFPGLNAVIAELKSRFGDTAHRAFGEDELFDDEAPVSTGDLLAVLAWQKILEGEAAGSTPAKQTWAALGTAIGDKDEPERIFMADSGDVVGVPLGLVDALTCDVPLNARIRTDEDDRNMVRVVRSGETVRIPKSLLTHILEEKNRASRRVSTPSSHPASHTGGTAWADWLVDRHGNTY